MVHVGLGEVSNRIPPGSSTSASLTIARSDNEIYG
jgi:hypothetical protein